MERRQDGLILQPMQDWRDRGILRAIANGLSAREQTELQLDDELDFMGRVHSAVSIIDAADQERDVHAFPISAHEARIAGRAIRANTRAEQRAHQGAFVFKSSMVGNAALPKIEKSAYSHQW
jgi:hypothetical protein